MNRINMYGFYDLGSKLEVCRELNDTTTYGAVWRSLDNARDALKSLLDMDAIGVKTCEEAARALLAAITRIVPENYLEAGQKDQQRVLGWMHYDLWRGVRDFETILAAELGIAPSYVVSQKNAYSTADLISRGELLIPESLRGLLPAQAVIDLQQAGRCLAFDIPTATAFHMLRATEAVMRAYYKHVTGTLPKVKMRNWGAYVKNLRERDADPKVIGFIDHLKDLYRNPVFHPEDNLTSEQAQMFLGMCVTAICQMLIAISKTNPALEVSGVPQALALPPGNTTLAALAGLGTEPPDETF